MNKEIKDLIGKCESIVETTLGVTLPKIKYSVNSRLSKSLGRTLRTTGSNTMGIELSKKYLEGCLKTNSLELIEETLLHELCHTLPNCFDHGSVWQRHVNRINRKYGYNISRQTRVPNEIAEAIYSNGVRITCLECGGSSYTTKGTKAAKHPEMYRCKCGGRLKSERV